MAEYSLETALADLADRKRNFNKPNQSGLTQKPREVYLAACEEIANRYEKLGFKYSKSRQHLTLKQKESEFIFRISFQSSHYNSIGYVALTVHAYVLSNKYQKWQAECGVKRFCEYRFSEGIISGAQIGNLQEKCVWLKWNVGDLATREKEIDNIADKIDKLAIPFFEKFNDRDRLIKEIESMWEAYGFTEDGVAKFLMYMDSKRALEKTFSKFLTKQKFWNKYRKALAQLKESGTLKESNYWERLAHLTIELDLELREG
ncbi:MAG: DUF4304 domain-containing protein [Helicobacteraceae bacterium]|jgi:hypothetical protein|nr:DUF4304 domain-containing protein [Helicobacteraceae bacterium]